MNELFKTLEYYWGYTSFLTLQQPAMQCVLEGRDSLIVLPTGGGKSLCFQAPALILDGMAVVVSPLISLMKDQVDALTSNGVPAATLNSSMTDSEQWETDRLIRDEKVKLLYVSPERLITDHFIEFLKGIKLSFIAIDEAHCISIWGHDFRPEYHQMGTLKSIFEGIPVHAYTATATELVRKDIVERLNLSGPEILVGPYDRPNLIYSAKRANNRFNQICTVIDRHPNESGIIYCIRRLDVEKMCKHLKDCGYNALPYHAGLDAEVRCKNQEAFIQEKIDVIVATIAFGMGIDKSNVRYVIHSGMPKSIEHYQQESGRAGRDGLDAECMLIYSGADLGTWMYILGDLEGEAKESAMSKLYAMSDYCSAIECRHKALVNYFGQNYDKDKCTACDVCLEEVKLHEDALVTGQKILSCIKRLNERFGGGYVARVLAGSKDQRILGFRHDNLSTYGLLSEFSTRQIRDWIEQLITQKFLLKEPEFKTLCISDSGMLLLKGKATPKLLKPVERIRRERKLSKVEADSWEGVDRALFERLRELRREIAARKEVPAYIIFGDISLRNMARKKPETLAEFHSIYGVGSRKAEEYGEVFTELIRNGLDVKTDVDD